MAKECKLCRKVYDPSKEVHDCPYATITTKTIHTTNYKLGFVCVICNDIQELDPPNQEVTFPICDKCITDLSEIIKARRGK